jgi:putative cell wall-binding protein
MSYMHRTSLKRAAAGLTALSIAGGSLLLMASPASAAETVTVIADGEPIILNNATDQEVGDLKLTIADDVDTDTFDLRIDLAGNCATPGNFVGFSKLPTSNVPADDLKITLADSGAGCAGQSVKDVLHFEILDAAAVGSVTLSDVQYSVGANAAAGPVPVQIDAAGSTDDNAHVATVNRIEGASRFATAAEIAKRAYPNCPGPQNVIIANGMSFPDALAANFLAGSLNAPVLLVNQKAPLPPETVAAIKLFGSTNAIVVGGPVAVGTDVVSALDSQKVHACKGAEQAGTLTVERIEGVSRYDTAAKIAAAEGTAVGTLDLTGTTCNSNAKAAILVSGENANYPDALSAGPLAWAGATGANCGSGEIPILLTPKGSLAPETKTAIENLGIKNVLILGGTAAITDDTAQKVDDLADVSVQRIAGENRQETATKFAEFLHNRGFADPAYIARGNDFADALAGGGLAGQQRGVVLLSSSQTSLGTVTSGWLKNAEETIDEAVLLGGTTALNAAVQTSAGAAFTGRN